MPSNQAGNTLHRLYTACLAAGLLTCLQRYMQQSAVSLYQNRIGHPLGQPIVLLTLCSVGLIDCLKLYKVPVIPLTGCKAKQ